MSLEKDRPAPHVKIDLLPETQTLKAIKREFQSQEQVALTLYRDAVHGPGDGWFGRAIGPAGQRAILPRS